MQVEAGKVENNKNVTPATNNYQDNATRTDSYPPLSSSNQNNYGTVTRRVR